MAAVTTVYFSGYGHTKRQAESIHEGILSVGGVEAEIVAISAEGELDDSAWTRLDASDAIVFGSPTYMGGPAWQFKKIADASSRRWFEMKWKDKLAGGFTNSSSMNGDKFNTIAYFVTLAMQHGMLWIGTGMMPANAKSSGRSDVNYLGGSTGAYAQSPADASVEESPDPGDLETARLYGIRIAKMALRLGK